MHPLLQSAVDDVRSHLPPRQLVPGKNAFIITCDEQFNDMRHNLAMAHASNDCTDLPWCVVLDRTAWDPNPEQITSIIQEIRKPLMINGKRHTPLIELVAAKGADTEEIPLPPEIAHVFTKEQSDTIAVSDGEIIVKNSKRNTSRSMLSFRVHGIIPDPSIIMQTLRGDEESLTEFTSANAGSWISGVNLADLHAMEPLDAIFFSARSGLHSAFLLDGYQQSHRENLSVAQIWKAGFWQKVRCLNSADIHNESMPFVRSIIQKLRQQLKTITVAKQSNHLRIGIFDESLNMGTTRENMSKLLESALGHNGTLFNICNDSGVLRGSYSTWQTTHTSGGPCITAPHPKQMPLVAAVHRLFIRGARAGGAIGKEWNDC